MVGYSLVLRRVPAVDVLAIAAGLVLRAVAGALLIQVTISPWLYLAVGGLGLILALGRIQYEMRLAEASGTLERGKYTPDAIERMNHLAMAFTLVVYCLYTFLVKEGPCGNLCRRVMLGRQQDHLAARAHVDPFSAQAIPRGR